MERTIAPPPGEQLSEMLDQGGEGVDRLTLARRLIELEFPYPLQIDPEDLALARSAERPTGWMIATGVVAVAALGWNAFWAFGAVYGVPVLAVPFWIGGIHSLLTIALSFRSKRTTLARARAAKLYRWLFGCVLIGPIASALSAIVFHSRPLSAAFVFAYSMGCALPSMLTALLAGKAASSLK